MKRIRSFSYFSFIYSPLSYNDNDIQPEPLQVEAYLLKRKPNSKQRIRDKLIFLFRETEVCEPYDKQTYLLLRKADNRRIAGR